MSTRIIGQDNEVSLQIDGITYTTLAITAAELTYKITIKETDVLGQNTTRVDSVFKGVSGSIDFQAGDPDVFQIISIITAAVKRRSPPMPQVVLKSQFTFPDSNRRALVVASGLAFSDIPITTGSREEHIGFKLSFQAEDAPIYFI